MPTPIRLTAEEAADLAGQIAALAASGLPLAPGLRAAAKELRGSRVARVLDRVAGDLDAGKPLDEAMAAERNGFPAHLRKLIVVSAKSGRLAIVLERFVATERNQIELGRRIWASLAYPLVLLLMVLVLLGLTVHWLVPQIDVTSNQMANVWGLFGSTEESPKSGASEFVILRLLFWLMASLASIGLLLWGLARLGLPAAWQWVVDSIPILGPLWRWSRMVQFSRLMEALVDEAIPLPDALRMTGDAVRDPRLSWACHEAASRVETGSSLSRGLAELHQFPPTLLPFVQWGQTTNNLGESFRAAAEAFEGQAQSQTTLLETILLPTTFLLIVGLVFVMVKSYAGPLILSIGSFAALMALGQTPVPVGTGAIGGTDPLQLLGGFGPLIFGLALLAALRILSDRQGPTVRDATQQALHVMGCTLVAVGILGTAALLFGIVIAMVAAFVAAMAVFRRRRAQQYALLSLLAAVTERLMPMAPAIEAFSCEYRGSIGRKAVRLAQLLRAGQPLPAALVECRGLVPREAIPILRAGYESGALAAAIRETIQARNAHEPMLSEVFSRIGYLAGLMVFFVAAAGYMALKIAPAMQKIFRDFGATLPEPTQLFLALTYGCAEYAFLLGPLVVMILLYVLLRYAGWISWRLPGTAWFVRKLDTAAILDTLSVVADRRRPLPDTLRILAETYPNRNVRARLRRATGQIEAGASWTHSLLQNRLLGKADLAVLEAAARVGNLPWAMREMADSNRRRWIYRARMWMQATFPLLILCVGSIVALYVIGYFLPLVRLIESLA